MGVAGDRQVKIPRGCVVKVEAIAGVQYGGARSPPRKDCIVGFDLEIPRGTIILINQRAIGRAGNHVLDVVSPGVGIIELVGDEVPARRIGESVESVGCSLACRSCHQEQPGDGQ